MGQLDYVVSLPVDDVVAAAAVDGASDEITVSVRILICSLSQVGAMYPNNAISRVVVWCQVVMTVMHYRLVDYY